MHEVRPFFFPSYIETLKTKQKKKLVNEIEMMHFDALIICLL